MKQSFYEKVWPHTFVLVNSLLSRESFERHRWDDCDLKFMIFDLDIDNQEVGIVEYYTYISDAITAMFRKVQSKKERNNLYHVSLWQLHGNENSTFHRVCYKEDDFHNEIEKFCDKEFVECIWRGLDSTLYDRLVKEM